jgi:DNA-binding transcriptional LysR family regulator
MDERRLRYFLAVTEEGGVTRAAARLNLAQPSLSQALRSFERELGVELFHRLPRAIRLSDAGEALVAPARQVLRAMDEARSAVAGVVELRAGTLEIAALSTLAVHPMAALVGAFRERHPAVQVRVKEPESASGISDLVRGGDCEVGLGHLTSPGPDLVTRRLGEQELLFVFPPEQAPVSAGSLRPATLGTVPLVVSPPGPSTRMLLDQALAAAGVTPRIAVETAAREAVIPLVLAGAGAALLPAPLAEEAARQGAVVRSARPAITRPISVVHRGGLLSPAAREFVRLSTGSAHDAADSQP